MKIQEIKYGIQEQRKSGSWEYIGVRSIIKTPEEALEIAQQFNEQYKNKSKFRAVRFIVMLEILK